MKNLLFFFLLTYSASCADSTDRQPPVILEKAAEDSVAVIIEPSPVVDDSVFTPEIILLPEKIEVSPTPLPPMDSVVAAVYMSQVGVRELTGKNDGKQVEKYLRSVGLGKGYAWCAAFVKWCFDSAGVKTTITAWSPSAENKNNYVYRQSSIKKPIQQADVFTIYFSNLKRIGHTGFVTKRFGTNSIQTVEGNTNSAGSREGDGVYVKIRPLSSIYTITRWL